MNAQIVLFEDPSWRGLQPLVAGLPVFELRCGLFSTRERMELVRSASPAGANHGSLLCRDYLAPLLPDGPWAVNLEPALVSGDTALWLSGRLAPSAALLAALEALPGAHEFAWSDAEGLLAARLGAAASAAAWDAAADWRAGRLADWRSSVLPEAAACGQPMPGQALRMAPDTSAPAAGALLAGLVSACGDSAPAFNRTWDLVPATAAAIRSDLAAAVAAGGWRRRPFGLFPLTGDSALWEGLSLPVRTRQADLPAGAWLQGDDLWLASGVTVAPGVVFDTRKGAVVIDRDCDVAAHALLEGPLYLGAGCRVKAGARLYGESSFGLGNRLAGEVGESTFGDFSNKQHEGFIGHAAVGSWVNLGALTTCSDLKNNYGRVRADLGLGSEDTGQRFVGLMAGDHVKTAIGTLFNTGTCVGFASNIFGGGMPPKFVPAFSWGGQEGAPAYGLDQAAATAAVVLGRRQCAFRPEHAALFAAVAGG